MTSPYPPYAGRLRVDGRVIGSAFLGSTQGIVITCWHLVKKARDLGGALVFETLDSTLKFPVEHRDQVNSSMDVALLWPVDDLESDTPAATLVSSSPLQPGDQFSLSGVGELVDAELGTPTLSAIGQSVGPASPYGVDRLQLRSEEASRGMSGAGVHIPRLGGVAAVIIGRYHPVMGDTFQEHTAWATPIERVVELAPGDLALRYDERVDIGPPPNGWLYAHERGELRERIGQINPAIAPAELVPLLLAADEDLDLVAPEVAGDPLDVVDELDQRWCESGTLPTVLVYAQLVALVLQSRPATKAQQRGQRLLEWVTSAAENHGMHAEQVDKSFAELKRRAAEGVAEVYVALKAAEIKVKKNHFDLTVWLYRDGTSIPLKRTDEEPVFKDDLKERSELLLDWLTPLTGWLAEPPTHEFLLPYSLLGTEVDEWEVGGADDRRRLGTYCPVVVRLPGRTLARPRWNEKWELLMSGHASAHVAWMHGGSCAVGHPDSLEEFCWSGLTYDQLVARFTLRRHLVCLALAARLADGHYAAPDEVKAALNDGLPSLIWSRNGGDLTPVWRLLADLRDRCELRSLPREALALRIRAQAEGRSAAESGKQAEPLRFTLVWDDPKRHPEPASVFAVPARRTP